MSRLIPSTPGSCRPTWRLIVLGAALALLGAGCVDAPVPGPETPGAPTAFPTPDPDTLVWAVDGAPGTLDPARMTVDPAGTQIAAQVYDRLMRFRPGSADLAPGIATDWDVDVEGKTYTLTLREGLTFHDGTPLDAAAVAWNFQRWMDPRHLAHQGDFPAWQAYFGGFSGQRDDQGREFNLVKRVEALDARTVRFTLNEPFTPFLHHLAMVPFGLASPTAVRAQGESYGADAEHLPVGSGPFWVVGRSDDGTVRLAAFEDYWSGPPRVSGLRFVVMPDAGLRSEAVASGAVHGAELPPATPVTGTLQAPGVEVLARPPRANAWLMLNHSRRPFGDQRVRRAVELALDRDRLAREHFGPEAQPSGQVLPPGFLGYDETVSPQAADIEAAKALMAEADVEDGFDLNIWVSNAPRSFLPDPMGTAETVAEMLGEIGIKASVRSEGLRKFLADRDNGRFTAWITGWEAQSADPDNTWFWHFGAGRTVAEGQYYNADLATSLLSAQRMLGTESRADIYRTAAQTVRDDAARVFLAYTRPLIAVSTRVAGFEPGTMGFDDLSTVSLAPAPVGATEAPVPTSVVSTPTMEATAEGEGESEAGEEGDDATSTPTVTDTATSAPTVTATLTLTPTATVTVTPTYTVPGTTAPGAVLSEP